jgi:ribosome-associated protein
VTKKKAFKGTAKNRLTAKTAANAKRKPARREAPRAKLRGKVTEPRAKVARRRSEPAPVLPAPRRADVRGRHDSLATAKAAIAAALEKKAVEPVLIDVCGRASYADFIGVVSGRSDRQVDAIADGVCAAMAERGRRPLGREGARNGRWVLIDFGDVVVHVFYHPLREVFDIESLWIDAPRVKLQIPAEARADARIDGDPSRDSLP